MVKILDITYYKKIEKLENLFFSWKKVCITWSFTWRDWKKISRDYLVKKLEDNGWEFIWSVSKSLDYLLAWVKAWSKLEKANKLNVKVIDLEKFIEKIKLT